MSNSFYKKAAEILKQEIETNDKIVSKLRLKRNRSSSVLRSSKPIAVMQNPENEKGILDYSIIRTDPKFLLNSEGSFNFKSQRILGSKVENSKYMNSKELNKSCDRSAAIQRNRVITKNAEFYEREKEKQEIKKKAIEKIIENRDAEFQSEMNFVPHLNPKSIQMIADKYGQGSKAFYLTLAKDAKSLKALRLKVCDQYGSYGQDKIDDYESKCKEGNLELEKKPDKVRRRYSETHFKEWSRNNKKWEQTKESKLNEKKKEIKEMNEKELKTYFKPYTIPSNSQILGRYELDQSISYAESDVLDSKQKKKQLVKSRSQIHSEKSFSDYLYSYVNIINQHKFELTQKYNNWTFQPKINQTEALSYSQSNLNAQNSKLNWNLQKYGSSKRKKADPRASNTYMKYKGNAIRRVELIEEYENSSLIKKKSMISNNPTEELNESIVTMLKKNSMTSFASNKPYMKIPFQNALSSPQVTIKSRVSNANITERYLDKRKSSTQRAVEAKSFTANYQIATRDSSYTNLFVLS